MKPTKYFIICILILTFFHASCLKDKENNKEDSTYYVISNQINESVYHKVYEPALIINASINGSNYDSDSVDLDNDGIKDILFESFFFESMGGYSGDAQFTSLNNKLQIPFKPNIDTFYLYSYELGDTLYKWYFYFPGVYNNDSVVKIIEGRDHPRAMKLGDTLYFANSDSYNSEYMSTYWVLSMIGDGFILSKKDSIMSYVDIDTSKYDYEFNYIYYGIWNGIGIKYLTFKIEDTNLIKYGWIKLDVSENKIIKIYEIVCFMKE